MDLEWHVHTTFEENGKKGKICIDKIGAKIYSYFMVIKYYYILQCNI